MNEALLPCWGKCLPDHDLLLTDPGNARIAANNPGIFLYHDNDIPHDPKDLQILFGVDVIYPVPEDVFGTVGGLQVRIAIIVCCQDPAYGFVANHCDNYIALLCLHTVDCKDVAVINPFLYHSVTTGSE